MTTQIKPVVSKADMAAFLDLPKRIYRNDRNWVPPLRSAIAKQLAREGGFREYGDFQLFIEVQNNEIVGRIVAATNFRLNEKEQANIGLFGYFECVDDHEVSDALFEHAATWLGRYNCDVIRGPIDLSTHINCLFLVEGFDSPPFFMMPYNPPYYPNWWSTRGSLK